MSTTRASKRVSRLRSREPSMALMSERKLNPRKVVSNRNSKKVNIGVKRKSLSASKKNVSLRNSSTLLTKLRPRRNRKNYCEDSRLLQQYISPKQQKSMVMLQKLNLEDSKKVPVYKTIEKSPEKSLEDKTDVYDFKVDVNDMKEKTTKKKQRKKNVNRGKGKVTQKTTRKKITAQPKTIVHEAIKSSEPNASLSVNIIEDNPPLEFVTAKKSTKKDTRKKIEAVEIDTDIQIPEKLVNKDVEEEIEPPKIDTYIHTVEESTENISKLEEASNVVDTNVKFEETTLSDRASAEQVKKENANKPKVISIENADNIIVTKSPPNNTENSWPFRPKNIFDNKTLSKEHNNTMKYSLLTKTLSPILKTTNTFDLGSPWRPPILTFSQTKHFIQSTPYKYFEPRKENKEINKKNIVMNKENMEMNKENMEVDKENVNMNKENKGRRDKERKKKKNSLREKHVIERKLPISENQTPEKVRAVITSKSIAPPAPARVSLGEIKNLLQRPNIKAEDKQPVEQTLNIEVTKLFVEQQNKIIDFSDTFDVLSETEKLSNIGNDAPLFMDLEPSHFSKVFIVNIIFAHICVCICIIY